MESRRRTSSAGTVLVVDPDDSFRQVVRSWLEPRDFVVLDAGDASDAERIARLYVGPIHLLLIEVSLPTVGGRELTERLRSSHAELRVLYTSFKSHAELARKREHPPGLPFLRKPFTEEQLVSRIGEALGTPH